MRNPDIYLALFFESTAIFMTLFFFIQYSIIKRNDHLFYALYLLALSLYYLLAIPDLFFSMTAENSSRITNLVFFKRPLQFLSSVFYTYFVIHYLGLKSKSLPLFRFFRILIGLYLLLAVVCLLLNFSRVSYDMFYYRVNQLLFPVQLYVVIALLKHKVSYSKYIIWGTIIILLGSLVTLSISMHESKQAIQTIAGNIHIFLPVQVSILIDMFLFAIALQKKIADNERLLIDAAHQKQEAIILERERIIADLHDDVGGGLSSIRMMSDLMSSPGETANAANTHSFAQKISDTAKDIAHRMHIIIWSLNVENDTLGNFVEYVRQYGVSFFENSGVNFQCISKTSLPAELQLKGVQRKNLFLIIKEAFHNILKHSDASITEVRISTETGMLLIEVQDNGTGIKNPNQFGNGLKNMKKRMDELDGNLQIISDNGTRIIIDVKVENNQNK